MSGWIVPVKDGRTKYPLKSNSFYIATESVTGSSDSVYFSLYTDSVLVTSIGWRFSDWGYIIIYCTPTDYSLKFLVTPPTGVKKTWEVTFTPEDVEIKCNNLKLLHFVFKNIYTAYQCTSVVKGKNATRVRFPSTVTATKMFTSELVGK